MMDDRKLLELAAKAAGLQGAIYANSSCGHGIHHRDGIWNPLINDGDALQLAVKLNLGISIPLHRTIRVDVVCFKDSSVSVREEGDNPYAATRRAIVRAAATIGQEMK